MNISSNIIVLLLIYLVISCDTGNDYTIEHTEKDIRTIDLYINHPVVRADLELINIFDSEYDFQLMNADEWGVYFDIIRLNRQSGNVEIVVQDSIHPFPKKYEIRQFLNKNHYTSFIDSLIQEYKIWEIKDTLNSNRLIDGGNLSIILRGIEKAKLITWQNIKRNETSDKMRVRKFYENVWNETNDLLEEEKTKYMSGQKGLQ